jgi:hypothetical protein
MHSTVGTQKMTEARQLRGKEDAATESFNERGGASRSLAYLVIE